MKFQNISIHGSKVMLCTRKHGERTNERTSQKQYVPHFFQSWGHKNVTTIENVVYKVEVYPS